MRFYQSKNSILSPFWDNIHLCGNSIILLFSTNCKSFYIFYYRTLFGIDKESTFVFQNCGILRPLCFLVTKITMFTFTLTVWKKCKFHFGFGPFFRLKDSHLCPFFWRKKTGLFSKKARKKSMVKLLYYKGILLAFFVTFRVHKRDLWISVKKLLL